MPKAPATKKPAKAARKRDTAERLGELRDQALRQFEKAVRAGFPRECPLCGYHGLFAPAGMPPRLDSRCPSCESRERHRLFKLWIDREAPITRTQRVLHFAPERRLSKLLRGLAGEYVTADLMRPAVDLKLNIEALDLPDDSFDVVVAHQILEHVDHKKALAECFRCLRPGGFVVATFPIVEGWSTTYENPSIISKRDRFLHFGQFDHIKFFGRDIRTHIGAAGFEIEEYVSVEPDVVRFGLMRGETLFILKKPRSQQPAKIGSLQPTAAKKD